MQNLFEFLRRHPQIETLMRIFLTATVAALAVTRLIMSWDRFDDSLLLSALDRGLVFLLLVTLPYPVLATLARSRSRTRR
jgi:hypothetical protein